MDLSSGEISALIFKRVVSDELGDFSVDHRMLAVFMEFDGQTSLGTVARRAGLNMSTMREIVSRLLELKLIAPVEGKVLFIDKDFFEYLYMQFSLAVGPVAEVLIEDEVQDLGYDFSQFPTQRIGELIDRLSRNIRREEKKNTFTKNMIKKIGEKRYFNTLVSESKK